MAAYVPPRACVITATFTTTSVSSASGCAQKSRPHTTTHVGVMGLGEMGARTRSAARARLHVVRLVAHGAPRAGVACYAGAAGLKPFLARTQFLVCLLPLTRRRAASSTRIAAPAAAGAARDQRRARRHIVEPT
jgi:glyoxylate/hydroxypyruvate reductase A